MIWVTWHRYRVRFLVLAFYVVLLIIAMFITEHAYEIAKASSGPCPACSTAFSNAQDNGTWVSVGLALVPLLVGLVLGAPIVASEFENKTNRLAWSQGMTRTKWLLRTWSILAVGAVALTSVLVLFTQWWATHIVTSAGNGGALIQPEQMLITGVDPIAAALLALTLGMFVGVIARRYLSPYATSVIAMVAIAIAIQWFALPRLASTTFKATVNGGLPHYPVNAWNVGSGFIRIHSGHHSISIASAVRYCMSPHSGPVSKIGANEWGCLAIRNVRQVIFFQPESHYWILQWREAGIYVVLAGLSLGLSIWSVRRWSA
jgi:ABC-type transport system involved in multi-copper enzyme maturation permease subunit